MLLRILLRYVIIDLVLVVNALLVRSGKAQEG